MINLQKLIEILNSFASEGYYVKISYNFQQAETFIAIYNFNDLCIARITFRDGDTYKIDKLDNAQYLMFLKQYINNIQK